jgi:hypothetical protein
MLYRFIQYVDGHMIRSDVPEVNLGQWCAVRDIVQTGTLQRNSRLVIGPRDELIGQPKFAGFAGPMWDGDAIRYEDRQSNDALSA